MSCMIPTCFRFSLSPASDGQSSMKEAFAEVKAIFPTLGRHRLVKFLTQRKQFYVKPHGYTQSPTCGKALIGALLGQKLVLNVRDESWLYYCNGVLPELSIPVRVSKNVLQRQQKWSKVHPVVL